MSQIWLIDGETAMVKVMFWSKKKIFIGMLWAFIYKFSLGTHNTRIFDSQISRESKVTW